MRVNFVLKSGNTKLGPMPTSMTSAETCPGSCPLRGAGCYAEGGALGMHWRRLSDGRGRSLTWGEFCAQVAALPPGTLWRHNQAGDLPGDGDRIDAAALKQLADANRGRRGFTYTHKPVDKRRAALPRDYVNYVTIKSANRKGFTINLSANDLADADRLAELDAGPVVAVLPAEVRGNVEIRTPAGRRVVVCLATYREDVTCASCALCARQRDCIVGFPAHGNRKNKASAIARGEKA